MRHITVRLPAALLARLDRVQRELNAARGSGPAVSRSGLVVELLEDAVIARERGPAAEKATKRPPAPSWSRTPGSAKPRPRSTPQRRATASPTPPASTATPSGPADTARVEAAAAAFREAIERDEVAPGDWHAFVKSRAPGLKNSAIRAWFNAQRLPARDLEAAARMLNLVEAWLDGREDVSGRHGPETHDLS